MKASTTENWRDIAGYEGVYRVSDLGRVRSLDRMVDGAKGQRRLKGKVLRPRLSHHGYGHLDLCQNALSKNFFVHRLVAAAFIGPLPVGKQVNHKDGCKSNNLPTNLEYVTQLENMQHAYRTGLFKARLGVDSSSAKLTESDVLAIRAAYAAGGVTQKNLANKYGVCHVNISNIVNRKRWSHI